MLRRRRRETDTDNHGATLTGTPHERTKTMPNDTSTTDTTNNVARTTVKELLAQCEEKFEEMVAHEEAILELKAERSELVRQIALHPMINGKTKIKHNGKQLTIVKRVSKTGPNAGTEMYYFRGENENTDAIEV